MKKLSSTAPAELLAVLQERFNKHPTRHPHIKWADVEAKLKASPALLASIHAMEQSGGEPDLVCPQKKHDLLYMDCSIESPNGRRSLCFDVQAHNSRKENKPGGSAEGMAQAMNVAILSEAQYRLLQETGEYDLKTSSWIQTPDAIRKQGGALFCDRRYGHVFTYHNGAESYYAARGFRACLSIE